jgi:formate hydrogenlyase subunit 6/NADH:ubiquinone oxidoreductase subunit I
MANIVKEFVDSATAIGKGLTITWKNMVAPAVTENYPAEQVHFEDRYREGRFDYGEHR